MTDWTDELSDEEYAAYERSWDNSNVITSPEQDLTPVFYAVATYLLFVMGMMWLCLKDLA